MRGLSIQHGVTYVASSPVAALAARSKATASSFVTLDHNTKASMVPPKVITFA